MMGTAGSFHNRPSFPIFVQAMNVWMGRQWDGERSAHRVAARRESQPEADLCPEPGVHIEVPARRCGVSRCEP